ncbi:MAG: hypothetical protein ACTSP4_09845 [Candidatus Hodarchaeales archaeon]
MLDDKDRKILKYFAKYPRESFSKALKYLEKQKPQLIKSKTTIKKRFDKLVAEKKAMPLLCLNFTNIGFSHGISFIDITNADVEKAILKVFKDCPIISTILVPSGFEYDLIFCLVAEKREYIDTFMDVFPLSQFDSVKRMNSFLVKSSEGFSDMPFWVPLSPESKKFILDEPWCGRKCGTCPLIDKVKEELGQDIY